MQRKFQFMLSACFLAEFGRAAYFVLITWLLYSMTQNALYTGLLVSLGFLPGLVLNLVMGVIVDRFDRKRLAVTANMISTLAMCIVLTTIATDVVKPWIIIGVHMLLQVTGSLYRPSMQAFAAEAFETKELPKVFSQSGAASEVGALLGSSSGGIITAYLSKTASISIVVICFILATIALLLISKEKTYQSGNKKVSVISDFVDGFSYLKNNKFLFGLFGMMFVGQLVFHNSVVFLSVYTKEFLDKSVTIYGFLDATISIGGIVAGILGTWWLKRNSNTVASRSLILVFIGLLCMGFSHLFPVAFIGVFLVGLSTTWIRVLLQSIQLMATDSAFHGRMASYRMLCNQGSVVVSGPILGWIASNYGVNNAYLAMLLPVGLCFIFSILQAKQKRFIQVTSSI